MIKADTQEKIWVAFQTLRSDHDAFRAEAEARGRRTGKRVTMADVYRSETHRDANRLRVKHRVARS